jgi:prepilin signal peptidase PulO-like enzyme (type II secretory pathway)
MNMNIPALAVEIAALIVTLVASVIDLRTTKIPNKLTFPAAAVGIIANFAIFGWQKGLLAIAGWFTGAFVMVAFNMFGNKNKMGFGDAKLIAAVGAFIGMKVLIAWGYFALLYGGLATIKFLAAFPWSHFGKMIKAATLGMVSPLEKEAADKLNAAMNKPIALAPYIAGGTLLAIILEKPTMVFLGLPPSW